MDKRYFPSKIVQWYLENKRDLPWRETADPYKIWLSEIILQQTRVAQGLPYYLRFIERFGKVTSLARASEDEVLRLWQGLGYYSRARNLHKCAKVVAGDFKGQFPDSFEKLQQLPGIGDYTAAAIASIAFREKVAVVDGNVFRVLARLFGIDIPINSNEGKKIFTALAADLIQHTERADLYNQALMEYGAMLCTPVNPLCNECIFKSSCEAYQHSMQQQLPVKIKKKKSRERFLNYIVVKKGRSLLMKKRIEKDIWHGLYDFPLVEHDKPLSVKKLLKKSTWLKALQPNDVVTVSDTYKHVLTHQTIFCRFIIVDQAFESATMDKTLKFHSYSRIAQLPKPVLISRFLEDHAFHS